MGERDGFPVGGGGGGSGGPAAAAPAFMFGTVNAQGVAATYVPSDSTLALFDAVAPAVVAYTAVIGTQPFAARRDHAHALSMSSSSNYLTGDVTMTNANTFYDGPALTLAAGTWLLIGVVSLSNAGGGANAGFTSKLWDGTTAISSGEETLTTTTAGRYRSPTFGGIVTPGGSTTYKISVASTSTAGIIKAAAIDNPAGNTASYLLAVKLA